MVISLYRGLEARSNKLPRNNPNVKTITLNHGGVLNVDVKNLHAHSNIDLETGLNNPRDPESKELRSEISTIIESL